MKRKIHFDTGKGSNLCGEQGRADPTFYYDLPKLTKDAKEVTCYKCHAKQVKEAK